jgi:hypothetical protein
MAQRIEFQIFASLVEKELTKKHPAFPDPLRVDLGTVSPEGIAQYRQMLAATSTAKVKYVGKNAEKALEETVHLVPGNITRLIVSGNLSKAEIYGLEVMLAGEARVLELAEGFLEIRGPAADAKELKHTEHAFAKALERLASQSFAGRVLVARS